MNHPSYTPQEIRSMLLREYDRLRENRFTTHHDAITMVAARFAVNRERVREFIESETNERNKVEALDPEWEVPDTFPADWCTA